jgi:hypothetical protein
MKYLFWKKTVFLLYFINCFEQKCKNIEHPSIVNSYEVTFFGKKMFFCFILFTVLSKRVKILSTHQ